MCWDDHISEKGNDVTSYRHDFMSNFFEVALFFLSSLVTGPTLMSN